MQPSKLTCPMQPSKTRVLGKHESVKTFTEIKIQSNQVDNKPNIHRNDSNVRLDLIAPKHKVNVDNK